MTKEHQQIGGKSANPEPHTPGPWQYHPNEYPLRVTGASGAHVCDGMYPSQTADARLIAAAPDLLEALRALVDAYEHCGVQGGALPSARAAIAKAEGR